MRAALAILLIAVAPASAAGAELSRQRAEKSIEDLRPERVLAGGLYSGWFSSVAGIYCDRRTGEIYVTDPAANTIEIFAENGAPLFTFSDEERMQQPMRVAVDDEDRIHVIDGERSRIKVYDYRGEFLSYLELAGFEGTEKPMFTAITFDVNGDLYVGESRTGQVVAYDRQRQPKLKLGSFGDGPGQFDGIVGIALDEKNIYVASSNSGVAVQVFSRQGTYLRGWGRHDAGLENVSLPAGIAVDAKGRVILTDTLRQEIKYFTPDGKLIVLLGGLGKQAGALAYPSDLGMDRQGRICVADAGNRRAQILTPVEAQPKSAPEGGEAPQSDETPQGSDEAPVEAESGATEAPPTRPARPPRPVVEGQR
jgi:DNA-binding beta-propeller fold protein YncE